jgi:hypothetical protein
MVFFRSLKVFYLPAGGWHPDSLFCAKKAVRTNKY